MSDDFDNESRSYRQSRYERRIDDEQRDSSQADYDDCPRVDPRMKVRAPGMAMALVGWLGLLTCIITGVVCAVSAIDTLDDPPGASRDESLIVAVVIGLAVGLTAFACCLIAIAGHRLRACRNYGLCMAGAVIAISTIALLGACGVFIAPFGIWAIVVLAQPDVKREFQRLTSESYN